MLWGHHGVVGDNPWSFHNGACKSKEGENLLLVILKPYLEKQELMPGQFILVKAKLCSNSPEGRLNLRAESRRETSLGGDGVFNQCWVSVDAWEHQHQFWIRWTMFSIDVQTAVSHEEHWEFKSQLNSPRPTPQCHCSSDFVLFCLHVSCHGWSWGDAQAVSTAVNHSGASQEHEHHLYS